MWACIYAYILIGPCRCRALSGNTHAEALLTATSVLTLQIEESKFTAVAVLSLDVLLGARMANERQNKNEKRTESLRAAFKPQSWACYYSVNLMTMTRQERLTQSACHHAPTRKCKCVCAFVHVAVFVPCICRVLHMGQGWRSLPRCSCSAGSLGSLYNRRHIWREISLKMKHVQLVKLISNTSKKVQLNAASRIHIIRKKTIA